MKLLVLVFSCITLLATAQNNPEGAAVMKPITKLFTGMNLGDSAMVHSAFASQVTMATVLKDKTGNTILRRESTLTGFLKAIGTPHNDVWSEPIWDVRIEIDGGFAQVWAPYTFYIGKTFSHCGVDAFQLVKQQGEWKIFHLADTRQKENCQIPKAISDQFK